MVDKKLWYLKGTYDSSKIESLTIVKKVVKSYGKN